MLLPTCAKRQKKFTFPIPRNTHFLSINTFLHLAQCVLSIAAKSLRFCANDKVGHMGSNVSQMCKECANATSQKVDEQPRRNPALTRAAETSLMDYRCLELGLKWILWIGICVDPANDRVGWGGGGSGGVCGWSLCNAGYTQKLVVSSQKWVVGHVLCNYVRKTLVTEPILAIASSCQFGFHSLPLPAHSYKGSAHHSKQTASFQWGGGGGCDTVFTFSYMPASFLAVCSVMDIPAFLHAPSIFHLFHLSSQSIGCSSHFISLHMLYTLFASRNVNIFLIISISMGNVWPEEQENKMFLASETW